jgi:hypothetical protein
MYKGVESVVRLYDKLRTDSLRPYFNLTFDQHYQPSFTILSYKSVIILFEFPVPSYSDIFRKCNSQFIYVLFESAGIISQNCFVIELKEINNHVLLSCDLVININNSTNFTSESEK